MKKTLKLQMAAAALTVTLATIIITVTICFSLFQKLLKKNLIQSTENGLTIAGNSITEDLNNILMLPNWVNATSMMTSLLSKGATYSDVLKLQAYDRFYEQYLNNRSNSYINRVMVGNHEGLFMQILKTPSDSASNDYERVRSLPFFDTLLNSKTTPFNEIITDSMSIYKRQIIPVVRPVYGEYDASVIGFVYMAVSSDLISDALSNYSVPSNGRLFFSFGDTVYVLTGNILVKTDYSYEIKKDLSKNNMYASTRTYSVKGSNGENCIIVTCPLGIEGWSIFQIVSDKQLSEQRRNDVLILILSCVFILLLGFVLIMYLNHMINEPVDAILKKVDEISHGDFSPAPDIEYDNEFGEIGKGINELSKNVLALMDKRIDDENQKHELEYQILQSQINPHFLYNTLNSIKWMATIQNATGIAEMTTALSRLLKSIAKGTDQMIPLRTELELLKDYGTIQQYRYGGAIAINYDIPDDILDCMVLRFSLQPLVENAIFHGIEAKGSEGVINVYGGIKNGFLCLTVEDNGVGMSQELIEKIMSGNDSDSKDSFRKIGISNVNNRIKYAYNDPGNEYGIRIESEIDKYTRMMIVLPVVREQ